MRAGSSLRPAPSSSVLARRSAVAALAVAAALGLAACGGDGDDEKTVAPDATPAAAAGAATTTPGPAVPDASTEEGKAAAVVTGYLAAFSTGDGRSVCKLYTPSERKRIAKAADATCAEGIRTAFAQGGGEDGFQQSLGNVRVGKTTIEGSRATVQLVALQGQQSSDALTMELERSGGRWLIARSGRR